MTYPPQQPGPYGQQPGGFPQQPPQPGGYPQQPYGQQQPQPSAGFGYPQTGPQPQQQPYGQQQPGPYGQQPNPYGQQPQAGFNPYGQQPGFPGQMPPKKKSPLPWILGGVGLVVVIVIVLVVVSLTSGGGTSGTPQDAAKSIVAMYNNRDVAGLTTATCNKYKSEVTNTVNKFDPGNNPQFPADLKNVKATVNLVGVTQAGDAAATAQVSLHFENVPTKYASYLKDQQASLKLVKEDGSWKVCGTSTSTGSGTTGGN